jgi:hypothetical protein
MTKTGWRLMVILAALNAVAVAAWVADDQETGVEMCSRCFGTLPVAEPQAGWHQIQRFGLGSPRFG